MGVAVARHYPSGNGESSTGEGGSEGLEAIVCAGVTTQNLVLIESVDVLGSSHVACACRIDTQAAMGS